MNNKPSQSIRNLRQDSAGLILAERRMEPYAVKDTRSGADYFCAHTGTSMNPTLCAFDLLEIEAYGDRPIRIGDVVFFMPPQGDQPVVHRVVHISPEGIRTKGDSNNRVDPWFIRPEDVIGQVVRAAQGEKRRPVYGGAAGQIWCVGMRILKVVAKGLSFFYHSLARSGLLRRLVPIQKRMRVVALHRTDGRALTLLLGDWVIGNYQPGMNYWQIRRPFRLFVDEQSLPR